MTITKQQQIALKQIWDRQGHNNQGSAYQGSYLEFRRSIQHGFDCIMVRWCGMWLGIELDGYTHS